MTEHWRQIGTYEICVKVDRRDYDSVEEAYQDCLYVADLVEEMLEAEE